jgi:hypothetical protein
VNVGGASGAQVLEGPSVQRFNMADATNGQSGTLSEVRRDGVRVSPDDIRPTDLVKLPDGTETTALVAKRLGFLNVNPTTGAYENPSEAQQSRVDGTAAREAAKAEYEASQQRQREEVELNKHPVEELSSRPWHEPVGLRTPMLPLTGFASTEVRRSCRLSATMSSGAICAPGNRS